MGFKDMMPSSLSEAKEKLDALGDKLTPLLNDFKAATKTIEALGFRVGKMTVGMGLLPEVHTLLIGEVARVDVDRLTAMAEQRKDEKLLVSLLKALIMAKKIHGSLESKLESLTLHVTLGVPPSVSAEFN